MEAAGEGDGAAVTRLLAAGADPNVSVARRKVSGEVIHTTALIAAAQHGRAEAARLLLDGGADPSHANSDGDTPLLKAAMNGHLEVVQLLLEGGVDPSRAGSGTSDGVTPLMAAVILGLGRIVALYHHPSTLCQIH